MALFNNVKVIFYFNYNLIRLLFLKHIISYNNNLWSFMFYGFNIDVWGISSTHTLTLMMQYMMWNGISSLFTCLWLLELSAIWEMRVPFWKPGRFILPARILIRLSWVSVSVTASRTAFKINWLLIWYPIRLCCQPTPLLK